ncbi:MAG TPA: hypothetical protein PLC42_05080 [Parachlamydiaceae bacterium]|nr:hypothetical protein [Parachlamydiaceae bacterium]
MNKISKIVCTGRIGVDTCFFILILVLLFFTSCETQNPYQNNMSYEISGRDQEHTPLYRIKAPKEWLVKKPNVTEDLQDTTKPLIEFIIQEGSQKAHITIHNFPSDSIETRIPPVAQIMRWKKQFDSLNPASIHEKPQNFSGFTGVFFEGSGLMNKEETTLLSWSMQVGSMHYGALENKERRASFTIKAVGAPFLMKKNKKEIIAFAKSFELIDDIIHD